MIYNQYKEERVSLIIFYLMFCTGFIATVIAGIVLTHIADINIFIQLVFGIYGVMLFIYTTYKANKQYRKSNIEEVAAILKGN